MSQLQLFDAPAPWGDHLTCWSMHQPYAGLVAAGMKTLESRLRPWPEKARPFPSPLLICATTRRLPLTVLSPANLDRIPIEIVSGLCHQEGVALAVVDVVGCRVFIADDEPASWYWDPVGDNGRVRYAWELAHVRRVHPFNVRGRQGFAKSVDANQVREEMRWFEELRERRAP